MEMCYIIYLKLLDKYWWLCSIYVLKSIFSYGNNGLIVFQLYLIINTSKKDIYATH